MSDSRIIEPSDITLVCANQFYLLFIKYKSIRSFLGNFAICIKILSNEITIFVDVLSPLSGIKCHKKICTEGNLQQKVL